MSNRLFRQESLAERNNRHQLDHLLNTTAPHERMAVISIVVLMAILTLWGWFGTIARTLTVDGLALKTGTRHDVVSSENGYLLEYSVAPGDYLEAGEAIARQTVPDLDREANALRDRIGLLEFETAATHADDDSQRDQILATARAALLGVKARGMTKELIVSPVAGEVAALRSVPGAYLPLGSSIAYIREVRAGEDSPLQVVLRVERHDAEQLRPGMPASVECVMVNGKLRRLEGEIASVTVDPLPAWLAELPPVVTREHSRVDVLLHDHSGPALREEASCRVRIDLGRSRPLALLPIGRVFLK